MIIQIQATNAQVKTRTVEGAVVENEDVEAIKGRLRATAAKYGDRLRRARRIFVEDRAVALSGDRDIEYEIKEKVAEFFSVKYSEVAFAGSAQVGFSVIKNRAFVKAESDLDIACLSSELFQTGWMDVIGATRAFTDSTAFSGLRETEVSLFKDSILRRGMIRIEMMPRSRRSQEWKDFQDRLSREYSVYFGKITVALYLNEYAFCWKQDSAISTLLRQ